MGSKVVRNPRTCFGSKRIRFVETEPDVIEEAPAQESIKLPQID